MRAADAPARIRTLIVEDDPSIAEIHRLFLAEHPLFEVVGVAHSGSAAVEAAGRLEPELLLLDFYLPDMHGLEVLRRVRQVQTVEVEVLALTAARDLDNINRARALGVRHYLVKPFTAVSLTGRLSVIAEHIERARALPHLLEQPVIDSYLTTEPRHPAATADPKGISRSVSEKVKRALAGAGPDGISAVEVGLLAGISRSTARRYLDHLEQNGFATVDARTGERGRPVNVYRPA